MQNLKNILFSLSIIFSMLMLSDTSLFAHFGSKGPYGGSVSVAIYNDTTVYIGTFDGGVYESTNSSLIAWRARPVGLGSGKITALAHSGAYLFAGTLDAGVYIFNGYVGTDRYWIKINNGLSNLHIKSLIALDSITLLAGTDGGGLYKTTNKGADWTPISSPFLNNKTITSMARLGSKIVLATLDGGVFISNNNGSTWSDFNDTNTLGVSGTISLSYNASADVLAVINDNGLFFLTNAATATNPNYSPVMAGLPTGIEFHTLNSKNANWYLATNQGVFVSTGGTWTQANTGLPTSNVTVVLPFNSDLVAGTWKEGIFKSAAANISWIPRNTNFNNLETYAMETKGAQIVITANEKGVFVSLDLAASYMRANNGLADSLHVTYLKFWGSNLYAATKYAGVFVSSDTAKTWIPLNMGLSSMDIRKFFASDAGLYLLDASNGLFQYTGSGWSSIQAGLPANVVPTSLAFYGAKMLLGTLGQGVFIREVAGGDWNAANTGLGNLNVTAVTANNTKLFAGTDGNGVFISDQNTLAWSPTAPVSIAHTVIMGLDGTKIQAMTYNAGYVYASYKGGLLASSDNGTSWIAGGNQFNLPSYTDVDEITFVTTRVFVTTENNCIYSNSLSELPVISGTNYINSLDASVNISPNPNNGRFTIRIDDTAAKIKGIKIFDASGRLVLRMTDSKESQQMQVSGNFSKGIYLVQILTDEGIIVKKVVME